MSGDEIHQIAGDNSILVGKARDVRITQNIQHAVPLPPPRQLPAPPADFTGRQAELIALLGARERGATISGLRGLGGVGKTALALVLAQQLAADYPDAQLFIDLMGTSDEPLPVPQAMRQVIHAWHPEARLPEDKAELHAMYCSVLNGKNVLLLLDNARSREQVEPLLPPAGCCALVTSRWQFTLPGLHACDLDALPPEEAIRLLLGITPRLKYQAAALADLCGCLPLALRVSASALAERPSLPVDEYLAKLQAARLELTGADAAIRTSYDLLSAEMQSHLAFLGVFPAPFDRAAAAAVWDVEEPFAQEILDGLLSFSLVAWDGESRHFRLHDLLRDFAWARLEDAEQDAAAYRHAEHYIGVLRTTKELYNQGSKRTLDGLSLFDQEWENIRAGQAWALAQAERTNAAAQLCAHFPDAGAYILSLRLHPRQRITWLEAGLGAAQRLGLHNLESIHLGSLGQVYSSLGEVQRAISLYEQMLLIAQQIGDRHREGNALGNLGMAYAALGNDLQAVKYYEQRLLIAREIGDRRGEGIAQGNMGLAYANLGETQQALKYHEQELMIDREIGNRRGEGIALNNIGSIYVNLGKTWRAIEYHKQALAIAQEIGDLRGEAHANWGIAICCEKDGQLNDAIAHAKAALALFETLESPHAEEIRQLLTRL